MRETGEVVKIKGENAVVRVQQSSACAKCHMCAFREGEKHIDLTLNNQIGATTGDLVELEMGANYVLSSAFIVYGVPLLMALAGLLIGIFAIHNELITLLIVVVMLVAGFATVSLLDKKLKRKPNFSPRIARIVRSKEKENVGSNQDDRGIS